MIPSSVRGPAAVHGQRDAGQRGGLVAAQEDGERGELGDPDELLLGCCLSRMSVITLSRLMPCALAWSSICLSTSGVRT